MAKPIIGAHVSAAGGLLNAVLSARHIGADAVQLFGSSPRQWAARLPAKKEATEFRAAARAAGLRGVFLHAPYLINLATLNVAMWRKSVQLLTTQMKIAKAVGATGVIFHTGSGEGGMFREQSLERAVSGMRQVLRNASGKALLIIENSAGGGERVGRDLADVAWLLKKLGSKRGAFCFDTAHAFEAGLVRSYVPEEVVRLAEEIARTVGWKRVAAVHANDSKTAFGSHHDRHENIGKGFIGESAFRNLLAHPEFRKVPFILEVPGYDGNGPDKKNVDILKRLAG